MKDKELILRKFGQHLRKLRKSKSLTLEEVEAMADIDNSNLSKIESGKINIKYITLYKLSEALDIKLSKFFEGFD